VKKTIAQSSFDNKTPYYIKILRNFAENCLFQTLNIEKHNIN